MIMKMAVLGAAVLAVGSLSLAGELFRLRVSEPAGVARKAEPVTNGLPFPAGLVKDAGSLVLLGADDRPMPASFTVTNRWPKDGSVRWVLLDAQVTVPAKGTAEFTVATGRPAAPPAAVVVEEGPETVTVNTGALRFTVRKKGFRLFESLRLAEGDANLVAPGAGLAMTVKGVRYTSAADTTGTVVVEESSPMRVALLATGKLTAPDGSTGYEYEVRLHAYAGSRRVKVVPTVIKAFGDRKDLTHFISDLSLDLRLAAAGPLTYALGGEGVPVAGTLGVDETAHVLAETSDRWVFGGAAKGAGKAKTTKPLTLGWANLSGRQGGVAAGVYAFWQTFPKAIQVKGDGALNVGLYPSLIGKDLQFFTGMARTHEVLLVFHRAESPAALQDLFVGFQRPIFAWPSARWICRSGALGSLAEAGATLTGDATPAMHAFDERIGGYFDQLMTVHQDNWTKRNVTMDAYGWLAYGDTLHWVWHDPKTEGTAWDIAWDSNYYDLPHLACLYFARTGDRKYLDFFADHAWHLMDIDVVHWDPGYPQGGGSRRCPATNHVGYDPPDHAEPIINVGFHHHKSESLFERGYLLGDRFALRTARELVAHASRSEDADFAGSRCPGHQIITLVAGYWHTGDEKYLQRARKVIEVAIKRLDEFDGAFNPAMLKDPSTGEEQRNRRHINYTDGILTEGCAKYYQATGDRAVLAAIGRHCDRRIKERRRSANMVFAHALVWKETGEAQYLTQALRCLGSERPDHLSKDMACSYRNTPNITGLLATGE